MQGLLNKLKNNIYIYKMRVIINCILIYVRVSNMELTQLREKLNEAKELYSKVFEIEEEVRVMIEDEVKKHKPEFEFYTEYVTDYFDFVMNDHVDIAEMMIMRDILNEKIDAFLKN